MFNLENCFENSLENEWEKSNVVYNKILNPKIGEKYYEFRKITVKYFKLENP